MADDNCNKISLSGLVTTGKELVAMLRDAMLLLMAVILIAWPKTINSILVDAGFKKGNIAGLEWEANLAQSDSSLVQAQSTIADLKEQNEKFKKTLLEVSSKINDSEVKDKIESLDHLNSELIKNAEIAQTSVAKNISANSLFIQQAQTSRSELVNWGVVYGGDRTLDAAKDEIRTTATKLGFITAAIYHRQGSYRSVVTSVDRIEAEKVLNKAKVYRKDSYIVNMSNWCPNYTQKEDYFECS